MSSIHTYIRRNFSLLILFVLPLVFIVYLLSQIYFLPTTQKEAESVSECTPTFFDGDGPYYYPDSPFRKKIVPEKNEGEPLIISGRVLAKDCKTVISNVILDIWQADEKGEYDKDWYRGKVLVDTKGRYEIETVVPKGYGEGTAYRPPHIHFKVVQDKRVIITSEMFFPDVKGRAGFNDAYIMKIEKKNQRGKTILYGYHDIIIP